MKLKIKIQDDKKRFIKNKGMHLLNNFVLRDEVKEIELKKEELFILDSVEFKHWFESVGEVAKADPVVEEIIEEVAEPVEEDHPANIASEKNTIEELRQYCKDQDFKGYTGMSKSELIEAINEGSLKKRDD